MLKKVLRYDFKYILKYWLIGLLTIIALSILGGGCIYLLLIDRPLPPLVSTLPFFGLVLVALAFVAFFILTEILIFIRFYKNFYTDEGYLTFTLPVKRSTLLNSKLIMSTATLTGTLIAMFVGFIGMLVIGNIDILFTKEFWDEITKLIKEFVNELGWYIPIYAVEGLIILISSVFFSNIFMYVCVTFASIIVKKAKVPVAIAIYYGANALLAFILQIFVLFSVDAIAEKFYNLKEAMYCPLIALMLLIVIFMIWLVSSVLYGLLYTMIDKKLNLA